MKDSTFPVAERPSICPQCGHFVHPDIETCPQCNADLTTDSPPASTTVVISAPAPSTKRLQEDRNETFALKANAILQIEPSGVCVSLTVTKRIVLGRAAPGTAEEETLDLTEFDAYRKGVSRRHCQLRRRGTQLVLTDLGSANGTFLNDQLIAPHVDHVVAHTDRITLGNLHITVLFSA